ncbi:MAG TPA: FAD-dependent oxidoreductase, partial [Rhodospirillales bacterium]|nr:FAD-dependent oxidoreductase [Rhodospirillales bacterium]
MTVDVAIIGGGISGLATAYNLAGKGLDVVVLERQVHAGGN